MTGDFSQHDSRPIEAAKQQVGPPRFKVAFLFAGVLLPALCLIWLTFASPSAQWQSGELHDYASLVAVGWRSMTFWPLVAYAMACFALALDCPGDASRLFAIRFGVYTGVLLALQYCLLFGVYVFQVDHLASWQSMFCLLLVMPLMAGLLTAFAYGALHVPRDPAWIGFVVVGVWGVLPLPLLFASPENYLLVVVLGPVFLAVFGTPFWALSVYLIMSVRVSRLHSNRFQKCSFAT